MQAVSRAISRILSEDSISGNPAASRPAGMTQMWNEMYCRSTGALISPGNGTTESLISFNPVVMKHLLPLQQYPLGHIPGLCVMCRGKCLLRAPGQPRRQCKSAELSRSLACDIQDPQIGGTLLNAFPVLLMLV